MEHVALVVSAMTIAFAIGVVYRNIKKNNRFSREMREDFKRSAARRAKNRNREQQSNVNPR